MVDPGPAGCRVFETATFGDFNVTGPGTLDLDVVRAAMLPFVSGYVQVPDHASAGQARLEDAQGNRLATECGPFPAWPACAALTTGIRSDPLCRYGVGFDISADVQLLFWTDVFADGGSLTVGVQQRWRHAHTATLITARPCRRLGSFTPAWARRPRTYLQSQAAPVHPAPGAGGHAGTPAHAPDQHCCAQGKYAGAGGQYSSRATTDSADTAYDSDLTVTVPKAAAR